MRKRVISIMAGVAALTFMASCIGTSPVMPPKTPIMASFKAPLTTEFNGTPIGTKVGKSTCTSFMALVTSGDCSVKTAAQNGGITKINFVEYEYTNHFFFLYQTTTTVVYGD